MPKKLKVFITLFLSCLLIASLYEVHTSATNELAKENSKELINSEEKTNEQKENLGSVQYTEIADVDVDSNNDTLNAASDTPSVNAEVKEETNEDVVGDGDETKTVEENVSLASENSENVLDNSAEKKSNESEIATTKNDEIDSSSKTLGSASKSLTDKTVSNATELPFAGANMYILYLLIFFAIVAIIFKRRISTYKEI